MRDDGNLKNLLELASKLFQLVDLCADPERAKALHRLARGYLAEAQIEAGQLDFDRCKTSG